MKFFCLHGELLIRSCGLEACLWNCLAGLEDFPWIYLACLVGCASTYRSLLVLPWICLKIN